MIPFFIQFHEGVHTVENKLAKKLHGPITNTIRTTFVCSLGFATILVAQRYARRQCYEECYGIVAMFDKNFHFARKYYSDSIFTAYSLLPFSFYLKIIIIQTNPQVYSLYRKHHQVLVRHFAAQLTKLYLCYKPFIIPNK